MRKVVYSVVLLSLSLLVKGQTPGDNCSDALALCPGNTVHYNNIGATAQHCPTCPDGNVAGDAFCYEVNNSVWYSFTTNSTGGNATVDLSNIDCLTGGGRDNQIQISIFSTSTPCSWPYTMLQCTPGGFSANQSFPLVALSPNTTYFIHVDGDDVGAGVTAPAECEFDILVSGPAVEPEINVTFTAATCSATGSFTVTSVTGAVAPLSYSISGTTFQSSPTFTGLPAGEYSLFIMTGTGCAYREQVEVPLNEGLEDGTAVVVNADCSVANGSITITGVTGGTTPYSYSLNGGAPQLTNTFAGLNSGLYSVTVTDASGCTYTYQDINVPTNGSITSVVFDVTQPNCATPTGSVTITPAGGTPPYSYSLDGGPPQPSNTFSGLSVGNHIILVFDNAGCLYANNHVVIEMVKVNLLPQIFISPSSASICQGDNITFNAVYSNGGSAPILQWQVNGSNVGTGGATFSTSSLNNGDVVTCNLTSSDPCVLTNTATSNSATITVTPQVNPTNVVNASATTVCQGDVVTFTSQVTGCTGDGTYYWYVNGVMVDSTSGATYAAPMTTTSEVICTFMCNVACANAANSNSIEINVTQVMVDAGPNHVIGKGESVQLEGSATGTISWEPAATLDDPTSLTPIASPPSTTTYVLTVVNNGCVATDEVIVVVTELIILPNTFTPNGDGINDFWHIQNIEKFPSCKVTVYDRWGQKIYNSTGYSNDNAWDGTYLGKVLPVAAYYYVIELNAATSEEADTYYGWVSIVY